MASSQDPAAAVDLESLTLLYSEATAYLSKLTAQLEALETNQTALLHSYHSTSTALADIHSYNIVAPVMEQIPAYVAKAARLKQTMQQQSLLVERMKKRAEDLRLTKKSNNERLKRRWEEEKQKDRNLAAKMAQPPRKEAQGRQDFNKIEDMQETEARPLAAWQLDQASLQETDPGIASGTATPSASTQTTPVAAVKSVVKRKKKARQAEIE